MSVSIRERALRSGKKSLYLDVYENGQRRQEMLKLYLVGDRKQDKETMRLAEAARSMRDLDLKNGRYGFTPDYKRRVQFLEFFRDVAAEKDHGSWKSAENHLTAFSKGDASVEAINELWLVDLQRFLLDRLAQNTARLYYSKVNAALNEAVRRRIIHSNPAKRIPNIPEEETETIFLEIEEVRALAAAPCRNEAVRRAYLFSCFTGLRVSDVRALRWGHVQGKRLNIRQKKTRNRQYPPLSEQALQFMGPRGHADAAVFDLPKAQSSVNEILRDWAERAGVKKRITYHTSRHTFATLLLAFGAGIYTVSDLMGHGELRSTQRYAKVIDTVREDAVARIPMLNSLSE